MIKKLIVILILIFTASSLSAFKSEDMILYPYAGLGTATGLFETMSSGDFVNHFGATNLDTEDGEYVEPDYHTTKAFAYTIGFMFDYMITNRVAVTSGVSYDKVPYESRYPLDSGGNFLLRYDFAFISIPVGIHYHTPKSFVLGGGAYYGIIISDDFSTSNLPAGVDKDQLKDEIGDTKNDIGFFLDLGYNITLTEASNILLMFRYKHGFSSVYGNPAPVEKLKIRTLTFNIAYGHRF